MPPPPLEVAAGHADILLTHDIVAFALPAAYFRFVLASANEKLVETCFAACALGMLAHALFADENGSWIRAAVVLATQFASFALFVRTLHSLLAGIFLATAAVTMIALDRNAVPETLPMLSDVAFGNDGAQYLVLGSAAAAALTTVAPHLFTRRRRKVSAPLLIALIAAAISLPVDNLRALLSGLTSAASIWLPIEEFALAHATLLRFMPPQALATQMSALALVTVHCQYSLGRLGVTYLRSAQLRKNLLLCVGAERGDAKRVSAATFARSVLVFVLTAGLPYMAQRTFFESVNSRMQQRFLLSCDLELRLSRVLSDGASIHTAAASNHTVDSYADAMATVVNTPFHLLERKLFSLPKLALLPGVFTSHPVLGIVALPAFLAVDGGKSWLNAKLTEQIEVHRRAGKKIDSTIQKVEAFDLKHAAQITSAGAFQLTRDRWRQLLLSRQHEQTRRMILQNLRNWLGWLCNACSSDRTNALHPSLTRRLMLFRPAFSSHLLSRQRRVVCAQIGKTCCSQG